VRKEDCEFQASLGYLSQKKKKKERKRKKCLAKDTTWGGKRGGMETS
jgi:hypothetical protein